MPRGIYLERGSISLDKKAHMEIITMLNNVHIHITSLVEGLCALFFLTFFIRIQNATINLVTFNRFE